MTVLTGSRPPVRAVIFDWGGTLTPWHSVDHRAQWDAFAAGMGRYACARINLTAALLEAEGQAWAAGRQDHTSATLDEVLTAAGLALDAPATQAGLAAYRQFWLPHTLTDPRVEELFLALRQRGLRIGVLSNTLWDRDYHREIFDRDGVLHLIDADVYSSETPWVKPHPEIFHRAASALDVTPPECVYVGDRHFEDVHGAQSVGMRAVLVPHSDIPPEQQIAVDVVPDGVATDLLDVLDLVAAWQ